MKNFFEKVRQVYAKPGPVETAVIAAVQKRLSGAEKEYAEKSTEVEKSRLAAISDKEAVCDNKVEKAYEEYLASFQEAVDILSTETRDINREATESKNTLLKRAVQSVLGF